MTPEEFTARYMPHFSAQQRAAVCRTEGPVLLLAVPGSGKTTVLVTRLGYMALCCGIEPERILTMTYTVAATREMRARFLAQFPELEGHTPQFRTINGVSSKIIEAYSRGRGTSFSLQENAAELAALVSRIYHEKTGEYPTDATIREIRTAITYCKNMMLTDSEIREADLGIPGFDGLYARYCAELRAARQMDYDDQMAYALAILRRHPDLLLQFQTQYPYLCVDESQDTSRVQHAIIELLAKKSGNLFMVGDEDQSIYGFRAAYPDALLAFEKTYPGAKVLLMEDNYRSTRDILQAAGGFIARSRSRYPKTIRPARGAGLPVQLVHAASRQTQLRYLFAMAKQADAPFAVLYRNNDSALPLIDLLLRSGVPYRCRSYDDTFFSHRIVCDVTDIIGLAYAPDDPEIFLRIYYKLGAMISREAALAACEQSRRSGAPVLACLLSQSGLPSMCREAAEQLQAQLAALPEVPGSALIRTIWGPMGYGRFVAERRLDPGKFSILSMLAEQEPTPQAFLARLQVLRQAVRTHEDAPEAALTLSTIHSSKGLEYDRVYLLDVQDGILPARPDGQDADAQTRREYEEDRRLFYVAMTRAKEELYLFDYPDAPSQFVREIQALAPQARPDADDLAALIPENACGKRYFHRTRGEGRILAQCGDRTLVQFADGAQALMTIGQMLTERDRTVRNRPEKKPADAPALSAAPGQSIWHKKYGRGQIVSQSGGLVGIRFEGPEETGIRQFALADSLKRGFLFFRAD